MEPEAYTIEEFCRAHRFSRASYFNLKKDGLGPREIRVGNRVIISREAAVDWRHEREAARAENKAGDSALKCHQPI